MKLHCVEFIAVNLGTPKLLGLMSFLGGVFLPHLCTCGHNSNILAVTQSCQTNCIFCHGNTFRRHALAWVIHLASQPAAEVWEQSPCQAGTE